MQHSNSYHWSQKLDWLIKIIVISQNIMLYVDAGFSQIFLYIVGLYGDINIIMFCSIVWTLGVSPNFFVM